MSDIASRPSSASSHRLGEIARSYSALLGMVVVFLIVGYFRPSFLHLANIENVLKQSAILIIMSLGLTTVFILRGVDLSVAQITDAASPTSPIRTRRQRFSLRKYLICKTPGA
jgi:ribose/xylose/arabinose/galactoside ABC-type transport system permease subunit